MSEGGEKLAAAGPRIAQRNIDWKLSKKFDSMALCAWEHKLCLCLTGKRQPIVPLPLLGGDYTTARFSDWNHQLQSLLRDLHRKPTDEKTNEVEELNWRIVLLNSHTLVFSAFIMERLNECLYGVRTELVDQPMTGAEWKGQSWGRV